MSMLTKTKSIFIVGAKRTPFGSFGGSLKNMTATDLGTHATKAALGSSSSSESNQNVIDPKLIQSIFFGNVIQSSPDAAYLARHIGLRSDCAISTPALTINRLCGSGFETVIQGISSIASQNVTMDHLVVCGGTENMSMAPLCVDGNASRWGIPLGKGMQMYDSLWSGLTDSYAGTPMAITAENLANQYNITREECDDYALLSQSRWKAAKESNHFDLEMAPIDIETKKKGIQRVDTDEHPRPDTSKESISKLKPVFQKDGVVTAANASGICDGAGAVILASEDAVLQHNLTPLARVVSYDVVGCEPTTMGIGPGTLFDVSIILFIYMCICIFYILFGCILIDFENLC